jgi:hypothetical protein
VSRAALSVLSRVAASWLGSYAFVWGFVSLGVALGVRLGMPYAEAQTLLFLLSFLVLLVCFCWSFVAASPTRVWAVLLGGGAVSSAIASLLVRGLT